MTLEHPEQYRFHNGTKAVLPFGPDESEDRLAGLRGIMELHELDTVVLTSMRNLAYYSGFLYCSFGRPWACVVTATECVAVSAGIDAASANQRHGRALQRPDRGRAPIAPFPFGLGTGNHAAPLCGSLQPAAAAFSPWQQDPLAGDEGMAQPEATVVQETALPPSGM